MIRHSPTDTITQETAEAAAIVSRARNGDQEAFRLLYERHYRSIYNLIYRMIGKREDAADLTAEVFLRALQGIKHLKTDEAFAGWIRRVAVNLCLDNVKRKKLPAQSFESMGALMEDGERQSFEPADMTRGPEQKAVADELSEKVHQALTHLSPDHRAVILLHHLDGRDVREIADIMGCSEGTVKSRLGRAREHLRRLLEGYVKE